MTVPLDITHQCVVVARLGDFTRFRGAVASYESDPWLYMRSKLRELEAPLAALKAQQLDGAKRRFLGTLAAGAPDEGALTEFRSVLDRYLAPGDYVDVAFHLDGCDLSEPGRRRTLEQLLARVKPHSFFEEERKEEASRSKAHTRLVGELWDRLGLGLLERALARKPRTRRRKAMVLRRLRSNVAEYCSVLHLPVSAEDTFSPFMLHRVEALAVACLRFMDRHR